MKGFSLIELVTVILLLGILSVFALGRFSGQNQFGARSFFDDTVTAVRFAQKLAISTGCDVRVILTASSYALVQSSSCNANDFVNPVAHPGNRSTNYQNSDIPSGFTLTSATITFSALGLLKTNPTSNFNLSDGTSNYSFRVHATTGLVDVI